MHKKTKNNIILESYPFRESFGLNFGFIKLKLGELVNLILSFFYMCRYKPKGISSTREKNILLCLVSIFFLSLFSSLAQLDSIDASFFFKYTIKCLIIIFFCYIFFSRNLAFSKKSIIFLFKFIVIVELIFVVFQYVFRFRIIDFSIVKTFSTFTIGNVSIERFSGTASEPGYLVPILALPTYYFFTKFKNNKFYCIASFFMLILTFSSFAYISLFILILYGLKNNRKKRPLIISLCILSFLIIILFFTFSNSFSNFILYYVNKGITYFNFNKNDVNTIVEWSATDRNQHVSNALNLFLNGSFSQIIFGHGTGGYLYLQTFNNSLLVTGVEEAYNLYLSTLTDRGVLGLLLLLFLFYNILRIPSKDDVSKSLKFGLIIQIIHYFFVGNLWLYFFWQNLIFLCGYNLYLNNRFKHHRIILK